MHITSPVHILFICLYYYSKEIQGEGVGGCLKGLSVTFVVDIDVHSIWTQPPVIFASYPLITPLSFCQAGVARSCSTGYDFLSCAPLFFF